MRNLSERERRNVKYSKRAHFTFKEIDLLIKIPQHLHSSASHLSLCNLFVREFMNHEAAKIFFLNDLQHTFADNKKKREFLIHDDALHARFMTRFNII